MEKIIIELPSESEILEDKNAMLLPKRTEAEKNKPSRASLSRR